MYFNFLFFKKLHIIFLTSLKLGKIIIAITTYSLYFSVYMVELLTLSRLYSFPRTANITRWWSGGHENLTEAGLKEKKDFSGRVQGLRLCASYGGGPSSIPDQGTRSHLPQLKNSHATAKSLQAATSGSHMPQWRLKIPQATTKTRLSQINVCK